MTARSRNPRPSGRGGSQQAYHVPHWRDRIVSVIRDGQSHPTPRSAGYDNEWARNLVGLNEDEAAEAMAA